MSSPRTLLSLPEDVLIEILGLLLIDTPRSRLRTAVLRSCNALYELGLPLLYRVVDLRAANDIGDPEVVHNWETLFGARGTLTDQRESGPSLGSSVLSLGLGGRVGDGGQDWAAIRGFEFQPVQMPHCTSLALDWSRLPFLQSPTFDRLLASLPITHLEVCLRNYNHMSLGFYTINSFSQSFTSRLFDSGPQPWPDLDTVRIRGPILFDYQRNQDGKIANPRISFSDWSFRVLAVDLPAPSVARAAAKLAWEFMPVRDLGKETHFQIFFGPVTEERCANWWRGLERIELRVAPAVEADFARRLDIATKAGPFKGLQKKILPLIVFVDDDGTERRLMDGASV